MKRTLIIIVALTYQSAMQSQTIKEPTQPEATENWSYTPPIVTPGSSSNLAPSDAIVLFDGNNLNEWASAKDGKKAQWTIGKDGSMTVNKTGDIQTKKEFGSVQLHIEWRSPKKVEKEGQHRGNSGIFLQNRYEVQVLDSYNNKTYSNGQAGAIYKQYPPIVNTCRKPGEWQSYDIIFHAPKFGNKGEKTASATLTVIHNGVLIQDYVEVLGTTEYIGWAKNPPHGKSPIKLQDHGSDVSYRNIWIREL